MQFSLEHDSPSRFLGRTEYARRPRRDAWLPLILVVVCGAAYGLFLVVPYYVNDLDRFPLSELAYAAPDASELWPYADGGLLGFIWLLGVMFTVGAAPFITAGAALWAPVVAWRRWGSLRMPERCALGTAVLVGVALIAGLASPFHAALFEWLMD